MDFDAVLKDYIRLRPVSIALANRLAEQVPKDDLNFAARELGMFVDGTLVLDSEDQIAVLMDHAIHDVRHDGKNAIDRLLEAAPPPEGSDELRLLRSMQRAAYTTLTVVRTVPGYGVEVLNGSRGDRPIFIADLAFSRTAKPGVCLASRIHSPGDGWWITGGAALPVDLDAAARIDAGRRDFVARTGVAPDDGQFAPIAIRACLATGASRTIRYAKIGEDARQIAPAPAIRRGPRVGRNDPCPCGSGKKYKKCCGGR